MEFFSQQAKKTLLVLLALFFCGQANAAPILFDFETGNDVLNPVLTNDGLTLAHSSVSPGVTQLVNDFRSEPFEGDGSMRLTFQDFGDASVTARVDFSSLLSEVSLWGLNVSSLAATFSISALSSTDAILSTLSVPDSGTYTFLNFSGLEPIAALQFSSSSVNVGYWDNLSATVIPTNDVPVPGMMSLIFVAILILMGQRRLSLGS